MDHPSITAMIQASEGATTGSAVAQSRNRVRLADRPPLLKEADLAPKHRLLAEYMVHGTDKLLLAQRIKREFAIFDKDGLRVGSELRPIPLGEPLTLEEAAELVGMKRRTARILSAQPAWQRLLSQLTMNFREGAKARAWRKIDELAHKPGDGSAAWAKVNHQAATTITGEQAGKGSGTTVNVGVNVGIAGYVIDLSPQQKDAQAVAREGDPATEKSA